MIKKIDKKKVIILTGSSGQVGRSFVNYLSKNKNNYIYALDKIKFDCNKDNVENYKIDITQEDEVVNFFSNVKNIYGLINNAGIGVFTPFLTRTLDEFRSVLDVNLIGTFLMCREAIKIMEKQGSGKIINIGSIYGVQSSDYQIYGNSGRNNSEVYSISKSGVIMLTKYLATHFAGDNIQVNAISPGGIKREQSDDFIKNYTSKNPSKRLAEVKDLYPALDFLLDINNKYTNGENIIVDGGYTKW